MAESQKIGLLFLRLITGWLFFYAGITKVLNPAWSAAGYLTSAKTFAGFYHWLVSPAILPIVNFLNAWGLTLIGAALILGIFVRWSSMAGIVMMLLYYFPILNFPYPDANSFLVDEHIILIGVLFVLATFAANQILGLGDWLSGSWVVRKCPCLKKWLV